ncbi:MAG TPA: DNA glycosylase, partial [Actinomycetales bacterium]|nr:DNA glycosylase [Actinomycetales bacterium]
MPEGDSVHHAARRIHAALVGRRLARAELRVPRFAAVDLRGRTVERAYARGKHLFVVVGPDAAGRDPVTLHVHLKMEGRIHVHRLHVYRGGEPRAGRRWRFPAHTARLVLATGDDDEAAVEVVGTELGMLRALTPEEADEAVAHLGPDLLDPDWDPARHLDEAVRRLASRPDRTIGEALLDQRNVAGIGTIYRAEVCFLRGVDPREPVASAGDLRALADLARRLLVANVDRPDRVTT